MSGTVLTELRSYARTGRVDGVAGRTGVKNYGIENPVLMPHKIAERGVSSEFTLISEPTNTTNIRVIVAGSNDVIHVTPVHRLQAETGALLRTRTGEPGSTATVTTAGPSPGERVTVTTGE